MTKRFEGGSQNENEFEKEQESGIVVVKCLVDSNRYTTIGQYTDSIH